MEFSNRLYELRKQKGFSNEERVLTTDNKKMAIKGLKIAGIILGITLVTDIITMIIYFLLYGILK